MFSTMQPKFNVILVIADSLRKDHVGCYGNLWIKTPSIDSLAKESVMYTKAYPESLPTIPVRRAIYTGTRIFPFERFRHLKGVPWRHPGWEPLPEEHWSISEIFKELGYRTALIGDNYHIFEPTMNFNRGFDEWIFIRGQEWDKYRSANLVSEEEINRHLTPKLRGTPVEQLVRAYLSNVSFRRSEEDWFAPMTFREGIRWLEQNRDAERFLLVLEPFDPHEPWDPPREFVDIYDEGYDGVDVITPKYGYVDYLNEKELKHMRANYAGEVTLLDKWFGIFMQKIYEMGLEKKSVIVFVSDHGHQLGEHGLTGKVASGLYPELMDIPLLIRHPEGLGAGQKIDETYVYNHDLLPTILSIIGIDMSKVRLKFDYKIDGVDIWKFVEKRDVENKREYVTSAFVNYVMYRDDDYWFISDRDNEDSRLYSVKEDPRLERNIASQDKSLTKKLYEVILKDAGGVLPKLDMARHLDFEWYTLYVQKK